LKAGLGIGLVCLVSQSQYGSRFEQHARRAGHSYGAGAAAVACVLFVGSEVIFLLVFECGDRAAVAGEVAKARWEGRLLDRERRALPDGRKGINFVAMVKLSLLRKRLKLSSRGEGSIETEKLHPMTPQKVRRRSALHSPRLGCSGRPSRALRFQISVLRPQT
jgi:hypothetical protein